MNSKYTVALDKVRKEALLLVGGKAANLGEMLNAGLNVPGGFVILSDAYKRFVEANMLDSRINHLLNHADLKEAELTITSAEIKSLFENSQIPPDVNDDIVKAFMELVGENDMPVAVRSSATVEDMPGVSFAGQYSSYLNILGEAELIQHVVKCWASLWNSRALFYRIKQNIGNAGISHGVVVQKLIDAEKSGVLFTANPLNGRRDQVLLNASWGLGEAIVNGDVNPDQWVIEKNAGTDVEERIATKEKMSVRDSKGIHLVKVEDDRKKIASLAPHERSALLDLAIRTEEYFGQPQDIEWACKRGEFFIVQSRPITSLYPLPVRHPHKPGIRVYINVNNYSQAMKEPFTPMGEDLIYRAAKNTRKALGPKKIKEDSLWYLSTAGGRLFIDITPFLRKEKFWEKFRKPDPADKDPVTTKALLLYIEENRKEILSHKERVNFLKILNPRLIRFAWRAWREFSFGKKYPREARQRAVESGGRFIEKFTADCAGLKTSQEKLDFIQKEIHSVFMAGAQTLFFVVSSSTAISDVRVMMEKCFGDSNDLHWVERAVPYSVTTEMGMELMKLAALYHQKGINPSANDKAVETFLSRYGHKKPVELDTGTPTWTEEPEYVLSLISSYMEDRYFEKALHEFNEAQRKAEEVIDSICRRFAESGFRKEAIKAKRRLRGFREMFGVREQSKFVITWGLQVIRVLLFDVGKELVQEGRLERSDDIFWVKIDDISKQQDLKSIAAENRDLFEKNIRLKAPRLITSLGETIYSAAETLDDDTLFGVPVSPGVCEGYARVLEKPEEGDTLKKGEILVTTGTNPAWTPLFLKIGALVMECGGPISHGSVVAREYGVPAVSGITNVVDIIKTGQKLRVNGESGTVTVVEDVSVLESELSG